MAAGLSLGALDKCLGLVFQYEETTILFAFAGTIFFFFCYEKHLYITNSFFARLL